MIDLRKKATPSQPVTKPVTTLYMLPDGSITTDINSLREYDKK